MLNKIEMVKKLTDSISLKSDFVRDLVGSFISNEVKKATDMDVDLDLGGLDIQRDEDGNWKAEMTVSVKLSDEDITKLLTQILDGKKEEKKKKTDNSSIRRFMNRWAV
jgi:hypothetical protein